MRIIYYVLLFDQQKIVPLATKKRIRIGRKVTVELPNTLPLSSLRVDRKVL